MSRDSNDLKQKSKSITVAPSPSEPEKQTGPTAAKGTARERFTSELSKNPRCEEAPKSGQGFVILGARPSKPK
jgi:hypothetical protein